METPPYTQSPNTPLKIEASKTLLPLARDVGLAYGITVYDAIYVSLAKIHETTLVTADKKLVEAVEKTVFKKHIAWLADYVR
jgi:predicted nucleic acid-binding protein